MKLRTFDYYVLTGASVGAFTVTPWLLLLLPVVVIIDTVAVLRR